MTNKINHILTMEDGMKFLVINQVVYNNKNYYFVARITDDESDIVGEYRIVEEQVDGEDTYLSTVTDQDMIRTLAEYLQPKEA